MEPPGPGRAAVVLAVLFAAALMVPVSGEFEAGSHPIGGARVLLGPDGSLRTHILSHPAEPERPTIGPRTGTEPLGIPAPVGAWPTYEFAGNRSGYNFADRTLSPENASLLRVVWNVTLPGPVFASPTEVNGTVFVGSWDGNETALFASNGSREWSTFLGQENFTGKSYGCPWANPIGVTSAAAVYNRTVFVGGGANYFALNASTGKILWNRSTGTAANGYYAWSSPLFFGGNVYIGVSSQCDNPLVPGALWELSGATGKVLHTFSTDGGSDGSSIWSSPTVDATNNTVWVTTGNGGSGAGYYGQSIVALNASTLAVEGSWEVPSGPPDIDFGAGGTLFNDPAGQPRIVATDKDGYAYAWNRSAVSQGPVWSDQTTTFPGPSYCQPPGQAVAPASFDGQSVYLPSSYTTIRGSYVNGSVRSADPSNGSYRWETVTNGTVQGGLASANGLVVDVSRLLPYTGSPGNCYSYSAANDSWLQVLDASDGRPLYSFFAGYAFAVAPTIADGRIFVGAGTADESGWTSIPSHEGHLFAFGIPLNGSPSVARGSPDPRSGNESDLLNFAATGGMPGYACRWTDNGLPIGATCRLPALLVPGSHDLGVDVTDAANESFARNLTVVVNQTGPTLFGASLAILPTPVVLGDPVQLTTTVVHGAPPFGFIYRGLPPGCSSENVSRFNCTPLASGSSPVEVTVRDATGRSTNATAWLNVSPATSIGPPPTISQFRASPPDLVVGTNLLFSGTESGGEPPLQLSWVGLPTGCPDSSTLTFSCIPSRSGSYGVGVTITDGAGRSAAANLNVSVVDPLQVVRFSVDPSSPQVDERTTFTLETTGGAPPLEVQFADLPPGCASVDNLSLSCTPNRPGPFNVTASVNDSLGEWAVASVLLSVLAPSGGPSGAENWFGSASWTFPVLLGLAAALLAAAWGVSVLRRRARDP
jgi:outer membrane protein assembly factor BamB